MWPHIIEHLHQQVQLWGTWPLDTPDQCDVAAYRAANPGLCEPSGLFPHIGSGGTPGGGGGTSGGLISNIVHAIGSLL